MGSQASAVSGALQKEQVFGIAMSNSGQ